MTRAIFISYRRDDTEGEAGRIFDDLTRAFGENSIFMDVDGISPGVDFRKAIDDNVSSCGVLLAVIGPTWSSIKGASGSRRLDEVNDFVRLEIASALSRNIAVIPVLVHDAKMPHPDELPDNLKDLAYRNGVDVSHARWNSDVQLLINALGKYVAPAAASDPKLVHATAAVQSPSPGAPPAQSVHSGNTALILGVLAAIVVGLGVVGFLFLKPAPRAPASEQSARPAPTGDQLLGLWTNPTADGNNGLERIEISSRSNQTTLHAWGKCMPKDCDWGSQPAERNGAEATATWRLEGRVATISVKPDNGHLSVKVDNTYAQRPSNTHLFEFVRAQ